MRDVLVNEMLHREGFPPFAYSVILTVEDYNEFIDDFYGKNTLVADDLFDYREYKINSMNISFIEFVAWCMSEGNVEGYKHVFRQNFNEFHIELIHDAIKSGRITLEDIFDKFKENPSINIMKYII